MNKYTTVIHFKMKAYQIIILKKFRSTFGFKGQNKLYTYLD